MLLPGRSLDAAGICVTRTSYQEVPHYHWVSGGTLGTGGGGGATPYGSATLSNVGSLGVSASGTGGGLTYTISGITAQSIQLNMFFNFLSGTDTITAWKGTTVGAGGFQLGSTTASYTSSATTLPISVGGTA